MCPSFSVVKELGAPSVGELLALGLSLFLSLLLFFILDFSLPSTPSGPLQGPAFISLILCGEIQMDAFKCPFLINSFLALSLMEGKWVGKSSLSLFQGIKLNVYLTLLESVK